MVGRRSSAVEQGNHNPLVGGSNPPAATICVNQLAMLLATVRCARFPVFGASCSLVFPGFSKPENVELPFRHTRRSLRLPQRQHRRIDRFVGQLEGAEMHP